jgi:hypothetical protein
MQRAVVLDDEVLMHEDLMLIGLYHDVARSDFVYDAHL